MKRSILPRAIEGKDVVAALDTCARSCALQFFCWRKACSGEFSGKAHKREARGYPLVLVLNHAGASHLLPRSRDCAANRCT